MGGVPVHCIENDQHAVADYLSGLTRFGWHLGLERIEGLLELAGNPHRNLRFVHVAGTNGKGSTSAAIANILAAAGLRVGLYTSPHLERYTERIVIQTSPTRADGEVNPSGRDEIPAGRLYQLLTGLDAHVRRLAEDAAVGPPTEFEVLTAAALQYFAEAGADVVVLETGLGGRLDATNVVIPEVSVITPVGLDHTDRLGPDLASIAAEKAGIIKAGRPVVLAPQEPAALDVLLEMSSRLGAAHHLVFEGGEGTSDPGDGRTAFVTREVNRTGCLFDLETRACGRLRRLRLSTPLLGRHQVVNAAVAAAAVVRLAESGWPVSEAAIAEGLAGTWWPGRGEVLRRSPQVLVDGAHNPDGMRALADLLDAVFAGVRKVAVVGFLGDKDYHEMISILAPRVDRAFVTRPDSGRAADPEEVRAELRRAGCAAETVADPGEAARAGLAATGPHDLLLGCGSLYLIGALRSAWGGDGA